MSWPRRLVDRVGRRLNIRVRLAVHNLVMVGLILAVIFLSARSTSLDRKRALVDNVAKNAPAGSETAVAVMKSAITAANTTYETVHKATKQAVEIAESNFNAAATAASKAATQAAAQASRSAKKAV